MLIKAGVDISRLNREIRRALAITQDVLNEWEIEIVVTSTYEGNHGVGSLHYGNDAIDIRKPENYRSFVKDLLKERLGKEYDVVEEKHHVHIEYDPKK